MKRTLRAALAALLLLGSLAGCSTARPLRPLQRGQWAADLSVPLLWWRNDEFAAVVGNVVVGARYGVTSRSEARLRFHPAALAARGIVGLEGGGVWHLQPADGAMPGVHVTADLSLFTHPASWSGPASRTVRGALDVSGLAHWEPLAWLWPYVVLSNGLVLADGTWAPSAIAGLQLRPGRRFELSLEAGWAGFTLDATRMTQPYISIGGRGVVWTGLAVAYRFGEGDMLPTTAGGAP